MTNGSNVIMKPRPGLPATSPRTIGKCRLCEEKEIYWLIYLMKYYSRQCDATELLCLQTLARDKKVCYLVDFDVIRRYLEKGTLAQTEMFSVNFIFQDSKIDFAIPIGAFEELLEYLISLTQKGTKLKLLDDDYDREGSIKLIAEVLCGKGVDESTIDELMSRITDSLDNEIFGLTRLLEILNNPRFKGVRAIYDEKCYREWLPVVKATKRGERNPALPRTEIDQRDAMNLAIVSQSIVSSKENLSEGSEQMETHYLLITRTNALLHLMEYDEDDEGRNILNGILDYLKLELWILQCCYPVIKSSEVMVFELRGGATNPLAALNEIQLQSERFRKILSHLMSQVIYTAGNTPKGDNIREAFDTIRVEQHKQMSKLLQETHEDMLNFESSLRQIEEARATGE
jgi:hypothetical protein